MESQLNLKAQGKEIFQKIFDEIADSWNAGNRMSYVNIYNNTSVYMIPNSELLIGKEAIKNFVISFPEVKQEYSIVEVFGNPELTIVRGTYVLNDSNGNLMDKGKFLTVFTFDNDKWIQTHGIWNSDLALPNEDSTE
jgi:hypothetical protein